MFNAVRHTLSLGQETSPADLRIVGAVAAGGKLVWDFVIGDAIDQVLDVYGDVRAGNYVEAAGGAVVLGCDVFKPCKVGDRLLKLGKRIPVDRRLAAPKGILTKPTASDAELRRALDELYRPSDRIAGGTAGALRHELATGTLVGGKPHVIKATQRLTQLRRIRGRQDLGLADQDIVNRVIEDLEEALQTSRRYP